MKNEIINGSFEDYLNDIKELIRNNKNEKSELGRSIREINFHENEVDANFEYFREYYDTNEKPYNVVYNLKYNEDCLYRKIEYLSDNIILNEVDDRYLTSQILSDTSTSELEEEIEDRWDCNLINKYRLSEEELMELLQLQCFNNFFYGKTKKQILCEVLGFNNSIGYTKEDMIRAIQEDIFL